MESMGIDYFTDKYSRFGYVDRKFEALGTFIEFKAELDSLLDKHIKALWLNQGSVSSKFDSFDKEHMIISQLCALGTLLNGAMEIRYQTLRHRLIDDWFLITSHILLGYIFETV